MQELLIRLKQNDEIIVRANPDQYQVLENNFYVHPGLIDLEKFEISDRIYNCPVKGKSYWVDLKTGNGWLNDICWVYPEPKKKYEHIAGWYGFYPSHRDYEIEI